MKPGHRQKETSPAYRLDDGTTLRLRSNLGEGGEGLVYAHPQRHKSSTPLIQHNIMLHSLLSGKSNQQRSIPGTRRKYNPLYPFPYQYLYQYPHSVFI